MFGPRIKLSRELHERLTRLATAAGYASVDEFIVHILEKTAAQLDDAESEEEVRKRLQGLGYLG